jgi:hypothetical protein
VNRQSDNETSKRVDTAFTLIEVLIIIVIVGIFAAVTVVAVRGITDKGTTSAGRGITDKGTTSAGRGITDKPTIGECRADQNTIATAVEGYFAQYGGTEIPYTGQGAVPTGAMIGATADATLAASGFLRSVSTKYQLTRNGSNAVDGKSMSAIPAGGCPPPS